MDDVVNCRHEDTRCLNEFELIRKYACLRCSGVMMCSCDESIGRKYLPHQLAEGTDLATKERISVNLGFQPAICRECRGLPRESHPVAAIHGRTSKIRRYYWREIAFRHMALMKEWENSHRDSPATPSELAHAYEESEKQAIADIKHLHEQSPKYEFQEQSQADLVRDFSIQVVELKAMYKKTESGKGVQIVSAGTLVSPEEYAQLHFASLGYKSFFAESVPFHVLFGTFLWLVIQDPGDPRGRMVGFGDRASFESRTPGKTIWASLPEDFGSNGYASRRARQLEYHFSNVIGKAENLSELFDYWLPHSYRLREYLWAHREADILRARQMLDILPRDTVVCILRYLVASYWERFCGWPDLLIFNEREFFFAEVKSSSDKLSEDQKTWIRGNHEFLKLPFRIVKIHKLGTVT